MHARFACGQEQCGPYRGERRPIAGLFGPIRREGHRAVFGKPGLAQLGLSACKIGLILGTWAHHKNDIKNKIG